jgi:large subunit ribosomal protein L22
MEISAKSAHIRISPRKLRLVTSALKNLSLQEAIDILENLKKRAAKPILLTCRQALGNAVNNFGLKKESLKLKEIQVGKGPVFKRWRAVSRGRARSIIKRTSHLKIILEGEKKEPEKNSKPKKPQAKLNPKRRQDGSKS